jgi:hypothetical protein
MNSPSKTIYIIGNGPSLNKIDIQKLRDKDTISFNRAYIAYQDWGFFPTYFMTADLVVLENIKENVKDLIKTSPITRFFLPLWSADYFGTSEKIQYLNFIKRPFFDRWMWGKSFNRMKIIANVGATSVPVLQVLGYRNFIILGTDCNYVEKNIKNVEIEYHPEDKKRKIVYKSSKDTDPNHFRPDYFGAGTEYSKPQQNNHYRGWQFIASKMHKKGVNIILCSPGSSLSGLFQPADFEEIVKKY